MQAIRKVFPDVTRDELSMAVDLIHQVDIDFGTDLIQRGEEDRTALVLLDGELSIRVAEVEVALAHPGEMVGEIEFFGPGTRVTGAKAVENSRALVVERDTYDALVRQSNPVAWSLERMVLAQLVQRLRAYHQRTAELARGTPAEQELPEQPGFMERVAASLGLRRGARTPDPILGLRSIPHLADAREEDIAALAEMMGTRRWNRGQVLCAAGEAADEAWFLVSGSVDVILSTHEGRGDPIATLDQGSPVGFTSLMARRPRMATCLAREDVSAMVLDRTTWEELSLSRERHASTLRCAIAAELGDQAARDIEHLVKLEIGIREMVAGEMEASEVDDEREPDIQDLLFRR